jgi:cellulose synthase/poly-beta-1,6-N-acetylglucosamine synthase-like glycosyltransferase
VIESFVAMGKILFLICITPLVIYSLKYYALAFTSIKHRGRKDDGIDSEDLPKVSIHIPVYNDPVVKNCIQSCSEFDYPKDKYEIVVIDDSNDGTTEMLRKLEKERKDFKLIHRKDREGFKAGALNVALKKSMGDIIVIFDSDYILGREFLKKVVQPLIKDENMAFVQTRWDYLNPNKNRISRVAMMAYNAFHQCSMPVKEKIGTSIFCGTGGAIRKSVLLEAGGWNDKSIAEDLDLTVRILNKGYKQTYLPYLKARGEVPESWKSFIKQQERWAYGTTRVMKEYLFKLFRSSGLSKKQKFDMFFITTGFMVFPFILGVTISTIMTMAPWIGPNTTGEIFNIAELSRSFSIATGEFFSSTGVLLLLLSTGYLFQCAVALVLQKNYRDLVYVPWIFAVGLVIQFTNTIAVIKALLGIKHSFYKTPKLYYKGVT